ncbi:unnamed protein product [Lota lota]
MPNKTRTSDTSSRMQLLDAMNGLRKHRFVAALFRHLSGACCHRPPVSPADFQEKLDFQSLLLIVQDSVAYPPDDITRALSPAK